MRCRGIVQRFYQTKKRFVWHIRHIGYWKRRDCSHLLVFGWYKKENGRYDYKEFEF